MPTINFLALISFMHEKWVGLNILGESAIIFLALVTSPHKTSPGGLDLSWHGLNRDFWPRQYKKWHLDCPKVSTVQKMTSRQVSIWFMPLSLNLSLFLTLSRSRLSILTFSKPYLDELRNLDLDWSRLSRPPGLHKTNIRNILKTNIRNEHKSNIK
jgi:hypothetical protein